MRSETSLVILAGDVFVIDGKGSIIVDGLHMLNCGCGAIDVLRMIWLARLPRLWRGILRCGPVPNGE